jgi:hypothetical protein
MHLATFLWAFVVTLAIEIPVLYLVSRRQARKSQIVITGVLANACTLPIVWFVFPLWLEGAGYVLVSEIFAVGVEFLIIVLALRLVWRRALLASILMNMCSFLLGTLILR